ncbi:MAG TPA: ATP synthase F1 subunit gamma [Patescibacteria group bacterium]|nr:ATP synthase F1 subunit gamma [Patescibacteria group bacterium]
MPSTQELTRRIKSIKSTRKITRAMQMVSAAKMRKAQNATMASRTYSELASELIAGLGDVSKYENPLLKQHEHAKKLGIVLVTTNKGLVGGFNSNLFNKLKELELGEPELVGEVIAIGKKGSEAVSRTERNLIAQFTKHDSTEQVKDIYPIVKMISDAYKSGEYKKILVVYNHFVSTLQQQPTAKVLLPFSWESEAAEETKTSTFEFVFEPTRSAVLEHLLPRVLESQIYQAILESDASEHSARMVMMKNATEAAGDLIDDLTLTFNQLRQNKITTELSEITAGRIALE